MVQKMTEDTLKKPDPGELGLHLHAARKRQDECRKKLLPLVEAGWRTYKTDVFTELAGNRVSASCRNNKIELFFYGVGQTVICDSAKEALEYVAAVEAKLSAS